MKFKKNLNPELFREDCDFWYDLTDGGYINVENLLADKKDIKAIKNAIELLLEFRDAYDAESSKVNTEDNEI